jgi:hypothetical protein
MSLSHGKFADVLVKRTNHYDVAFEEYLRGTRTPYVAVDEQRRAKLADASLKSMDFIVTSPRFQNLLVDVKGRKFPSGSDGAGSGHKWENWATEDDIASLLRWQQVFGHGFRSMLLFAYEIVDSRFVRELGRPFVHHGRAYSFFGVWADQYHLAMRPRSASWETVSLQSRNYRDLRIPIAELLEC